MTDAPSSPTNQPVAPAWHTCLYLFYRAFATWLFYRSTRNPSLQPAHSQFRFYLYLILGDLLMLLYVAWGLRLRNHSLQELISGRWTSFQDVFRDFRAAILFWIAALFVLAGLSVLLHAPPARQAVRILIPLTRAELYLWFLVAIAAGVGEEIIYRGYLQRQFAAWTSNVDVAMVLSAGLFGVGHLYQGWQRAIMLGIYGWLFGWLARRKNSLRPGILAHSWQDSLAGIFLFVFKGH